MNPELITWARKRAKLRLETLAAKKDFTHLREWEAGRVKPTRDQLLRFAQEVHVPEGYLYLSEPPDESFEAIGLRDFRTVGGAEAEPSPDMIDVIYACQRRQAWFRDYAMTEGIKPSDFFNGTTSSKSPAQEDGAINIARDMSAALKFGCGEQEKFEHVDDAIGQFMAAARTAGVLAIRQARAGNDEQRVLRSEEFRGFALSDTVAPLVFINGADSKYAQMFTLAHELAHLWLGDDSGVSDANYGKEALCNRIAAEFLVPMEKLSDMNSFGLDDVWRKADSLHVSRRVILRRLLDGNRIHRATYDVLVQEASNRYNFAPEDVIAKKRSAVQESAAPQSRGEEVISELGEVFVRAVITKMLEGDTQYTEAIGLLDAKNTATLSELEEMLDCQGAG